MKKENNYYTVQHCKKCGKNIKIDALDVLLNLDNDKVRVCNVCNRQEENHDKIRSNHHQTRI